MTGNGGNPCSLALERILKEKREKQERALVDYQKAASQTRKEPHSTTVVKLKRLASEYETSLGRMSSQQVAQTQVLKPDRVVFSRQATTDFDTSENESRLSQAKIGLKGVAAISYMRK